MAWSEWLLFYWREITAWIALFNLVLAVATIAWILAIKRDSTSALAWSLLVLLIPLLGAFLFALFGYQYVYRPLARKRKHRLRYRLRARPAQADEAPPDTAGADLTWDGMSRLAQMLGGSPRRTGNQITLYHEGAPAYEAMLAAIRSARHHIHLQTFIFQPDASGRLFLDELAQKVRAGVQVRLLYDAMGSHRLMWWSLRALTAAGGKCCAFLPISLLRRSMQVNLRNHRKILVVDGVVGFTGGLNIGDEYLGKDPTFGFWRDTHLRIEGPSVHALQQAFIEDWDFAADERLDLAPYCPEPSVTAETAGAHTSAVQVIESGPDQEVKAIREVYFAAILRARQRLWIASPYFVPDVGMMDALRLAGHMGVDVRLLCLYYPDKWLPYLAGRYYWTDVLNAGVKVYQYTKGMMHAKVMLVDGEWASVGSANLDNRSLFLNFELNCLIYDAKVVAELEEQFERDLETAIRVAPVPFARRPLAARALENAARLFSPVL